MSLFNKLLNRPPRAPGRGDNVTFGIGSTPDARAELVRQQVAMVRPGEYVVFSDRDRVHDYVQFARHADGSLLMEVASGAYHPGGKRLGDDSRAIHTLAQLGLTAAANENFSAPRVEESPDVLAVWTEQVFIHLFGADEQFTLEALGDPTRRDRQSA